ncbi:hypothetical protein ACWEQK_28760 [Streptomyces parvulus]
MERYRVMFWLVVLAPIVLGLLLLFLVALPGDLNTGRMLRALAVYLAALGCGVLIARRLDR